MKRRFPFFAFLLLAALLRPAHAAAPQDGIKNATDHILAILRDKDLTGDTNAGERHRRIRAEMDARFDWAAVARGCLGRHWSKRSATEQGEFVTVFSQFLINTYTEKFEASSDEVEKVEYPSERIIDNYASVKVLVTTKEEVTHPMEFRMQEIRRTGDWRIYDVLIEGVSLVKNYREQFEDIIAKSSYEKLLQDLKAKLKAASSTPSGGTERSAP